MLTRLQVSVVYFVIYLHGLKEGNVTIAEAHDISQSLYYVMLRHE